MSLATRTLQICLLVNFVFVSLASASQVRLSTTDGLGSSDHWTDYPEVAFNTVRNEFLVDWTASEDGNGQQPSEWELFARRVSADTGLPISPQYRLTYFGDADDATDRPDRASLAYNPDLDEYLLVFEGKLNGEKEIHGLLLHGSGVPITSSFRISDMGPELDSDFAAFAPDVVYNQNHMEYLVVWHGDDDSDGHVNGELEVYAQRMSVNGLELGDNDIRVSEAGPVGDFGFDAQDASVAFDPASDRYLLAWSASGDIEGQVEGEHEIFIQLLHGQFATTLLGTERRISAVDGLGNPDVDAEEPGVAFHAGVGEYLVMWTTYDNGGPFGRRLMGQRIDSATGADVGGDADLTFMPELSIRYKPAVAYSPAADQYLVATTVADDDPPVGIGYEIFLLRLSSQAVLQGEPVRQSYMGIGPGTFDAESPALAVHEGTGASIAVWTGDHDGEGMVDNEYEIFSNFTSHELFVDDFESGDLLGWSAIVD